MSNPVPDPFDLDALRATPLEIDLERVLTTVPVRRPRRNEFFRVHRDAEFMVDAFVLEYESEMDREIYWVDPLVRAELADELRPVRLLTCITKRSTVFIWPAKLPSAANNSGRDWARSALEAAETAKDLWVKLIGNKELGAYEYVKARGDMGGPQWPADKTFGDLLRLAFKDKLISTLEHPVIREIYGEI